MLRHHEDWTQEIEKELIDLVKYPYSGNSSVNKNIRRIDTKINELARILGYEWKYPSENGKWVKKNGRKKK